MTYQWHRLITVFTLTSWKWLAKWKWAWPYIPPSGSSECLLTGKKKNRTNQSSASLKRVRWFETKHFECFYCVSVTYPFKYPDREMPGLGLSSVQSQLHIFVSVSINNLNSQNICAALLVDSKSWIISAYNVSMLRDTKLFLWADPERSTKH